jgi:hypothetical protein
MIKTTDKRKKRRKEIHFKAKMFVQIENKFRSKPLNLC